MALLKCETGIHMNRLAICFILSGLLTCVACTPEERARIKAEAAQQRIAAAQLGRACMLAGQSWRDCERACGSQNRASDRADVYDECTDAAREALRVGADHWRDRSTLKALDGGPKPAE